MFVFKVRGVLCSSSRGTGQKFQWTLESAELCEPEDHGSTETREDRLTEDGERRTDDK